MKPSPNTTADRMSPAKRIALSIAAAATGAAIVAAGAATEMLAVGVWWA